jgi:general stress protein 26
MSDLGTTQTGLEAETERLLAAARATISEVPFCWVVTPAGNCDANARVVKTQRNGAGEDFWVRWFLTPRVGRKSSEIRRAGRVTLAYQHDAGTAYVAVAGRAELIDDRDEVNNRFRGSAYDDAEGLVAASLIAVRVTVDHLELHVRGVTAEPWGRGRTVLERDEDGAWRLLPVHYDAPVNLS